MTLSVTKTKRTTKLLFGDLIMAGLSPLLTPTPFRNTSYADAIAHISAYIPSVNDIPTCMSSGLLKDLEILASGVRNHVLQCFELTTQYVFDVRNGRNGWSSTFGSVARKLTRQNSLWKLLMSYSWDILPRDVYFCQQLSSSVMPHARLLWFIKRLTTPAPVFGTLSWLMARMWSIATSST